MNNSSAMFLQDITQINLKLNLLFNNCTKKNFKFAVIGTKIISSQSFKKMRNE